MQIQTSRRIQNVRRSFVREILKMTQRPDVISFAGGLPNADLIPVKALAAAAQEVLARDGSAALQYCSSEGYLPLCEWIVDRYKREGVAIKPDQVLITTGSQQALDLVGKVFVDPGAGVIVEQPTYIAAIQVFQIYQAALHSVPMDDQGIQIAPLEAALKDDAKLVYCMPNFQNPSGVSYSAARREDLARVVGDSAAIVIEDDPYGPLRFRGTTPPSLATYLPGRTLLLGSFSKVVAPGLRIGWIVAPTQDLTEKLVIAKQAADLHTDNFAQRMIHHFLTHNDFDQHLGTIRERYRKQCEAMLCAIDAYFPKSVHTTKPEGGMFLWVTLPPDINTTDLFYKAVEKGVAFVPGSAFHASGGGENTMRMNFSNCDEKRIDEGIKRLADEIVLPSHSDQCAPAPDRIATPR